MNRIVEYGREAQEKILAGIDKVADVVQSTYGPMGNNVIIYTGGYEPLITKDGETAGNSVDSDDPFERIGVLLEKGVISKVNEITGDGSTTTALYSRALFRQAFRIHSLGFNPKEARKGMRFASDEAVKFLKSKVVSVTGERVKEIAKLSSNGNEEIADLLMQAFKLVGVDGMVRMEDSYRRDGSSYVEPTVGINWSAKMISEVFIGDAAKNETVIKDPYILLLGFILDDWEKVAPIVNLAQYGDKPLVIIAPNFNPAVIQNAVASKTMLVMGPPKSDGEYKDLAVLLGTTVATDLNVLQNKITELKHLGSAKSITATLKDVTIIQKEELTEEEAKVYSEYVESLKKELNTADTLTETANENLRKRIAKFSGGIATVYVGGKTSTEREEKWDAIEDALNSCQSALEGGVLPGGGMAMLRTAEYLSKHTPKKESKDFIEGYNAVIETLRVPATILLQTVFPDDYQYILQKLAKCKDFYYGIDLTTEKYGNLIDMGIIDAGIIEYTCIDYTCSQVGAFLLSSGVIVNGTNNITHGYNSEKIMRS